MKTILGIVGAILLALFVYWLNGRNNRINRYANASGKFRSIIIHELKDIYPSPVNWPNDIDAYLRSRFTTLQAAVEEFRNYLPWYKRYFFDQDWFRYRCSTGRKIDIQCYHHYLPFKSVSVIKGKEYRQNNTETYKDNFKNNVDALLKYAKQK